MKHNFFGVHDLILLLAAVTLIVLQLEGFADDPGVGWHLKNGMLITERLELSENDPFLYSAEPRQWVSDQWLSDVVIAELYHQGSWPLLYAAGVVVYLGIFFLVLYFGAGRRYGSYVAASLATLLGFKLAQIHFILRPVMLGFLFFALNFVLVLWLYRSAKQATLGAVRSLVILLYSVLLFLWWANSHPSFVLGLLVTALVSIALLADRIFFAEKVPSRTVIFSFIMLLCSAVITLVNPYGARLHQSILELGRSHYFMSLHEEWQPLNLLGPDAEIFLLIIGIVFCSLFLAGSQKLRVRCFEFSLFLVFALLSIKMTRMLPFFAIVMIPMLTSALGNFANAFAFGPLGALRKFASMLESIEAREKRSTAGILAFSALTLIILGAAIRQGSIPLYRGEFGPSTKSFPYAAVKSITQSSADARAVIAATPDWGGFISLFGEGKVRAVIDDRNGLLGEDFYKTFFKQLSTTTTWEEREAYLHTLGVTHLLLGKSSPLATLIKNTKRYKVIFEDDVAILVLFERHHLLDSSASLQAQVG